MHFPTLHQASEYARQTSREGDLCYVVIEETHYRVDCASGMDAQDVIDTGDFVAAYRDGVDVDDE